MTDHQIWSANQNALPLLRTEIFLSQFVEFVLNRPEIWGLPLDSIDRCSKPNESTFAT